MKIHHSKSIKEAIDTLEEFFECDLYTKFRPEHQFKVKGQKEKWFREDVFLNVKEFQKYLDDHFNVLRKEIIRLIGKRELVKEIKR